MTDPLLALWQRTLDTIEKHGWAVQHVFSGQDSAIYPSISYSIGLSAKRFPELLTFGLPPEVAQTLINTIARQMRDGVLHVKDRLILNEVANMPLCLKSVDLIVAGEYALGARRLARENGYSLSFLQVVFPDANGIFPWHPDCDPAMARIQHLNALLPSTSVPVDPKKLH